MGSEYHDNLRGIYRKGRSDALSGKSPDYLDFGLEKLASAEIYFCGYFRGLVKKGLIKKPEASEEKPAAEEFREFKKFKEDFIRGSIASVWGQPDEWHIPAGQEKPQGYRLGQELIGNLRSGLSGLL